MQDNLSTILTNTKHAFYTLFHLTTTTTTTTIITTTRNVTAITITTTTTTNLHISFYRNVSLVHTKIQSITTNTFWHSGKNFSTVSIEWLHNYNHFNILRCIIVEVSAQVDNSVLLLLILLQIFLVNNKTYSPDR